MSRGVVSLVERGNLEACTVGTVRRVLRALDARGSLAVNWGAAGDLDRLVDAGHASVVERWASLHEGFGWSIWVEASYSVYGERGRIDMLAYHLETRTLEVVEVKTTISDVQDTLGRHDAKVRLASRIVRERDWRPARVVPSLVVAEGRTTRRRLAEHRALFSRYELRGRSALAWIRDPTPPTSGLLAFVSSPYANQRDLRRAGQLRVRLQRPR